MYRADYTYRRHKDLDKAARLSPEIEGVESRLFKITNTTVLNAGQARYVYTLYQARVQNVAGGYQVATTANTYPHTGLSVSELSNASAFYAYGVTKANLPAGFTAKPIPINTFVLAVPHRNQDGTLLWLILNTQAIDGVCDTPLTGDTDYGSILQPLLDDEYGTFDAEEGETDHGAINVYDYATFAFPMNDLDFATFANPYLPENDMGTFT
jgi:hypothetical protein